MTMTTMYNAQTPATGTTTPCVSTAGPPLKEASINTTLSTYQHVTVVSLCVHTAISGQDQETLFRTGHLHYPQTGKAFTLDWTDHIGIVFPTY